MAPLWQRLRNTYLPSLLNAIKGANPSAPVSPFTLALPPLLTVTFQAEALWMTASERVSFNPPFESSTRRTPRWGDIPVINFNSYGGNAISPTDVTRAIEACQVQSHRLRPDADFSSDVVDNL